MFVFCAQWTLYSFRLTVQLNYPALLQCENVVFQVFKRIVWWTRPTLFRSVRPHHWQVARRNFAKKKKLGKGEYKGAVAQTLRPRTVSASTQLQWLSWKPVACTKETDDNLPEMHKQMVLLSFACFRKKNLFFTTKRAEKEKQCIFALQKSDHFPVPGREKSRIQSRMNGEWRDSLKTYATSKPLSAWEGLSSRTGSRSWPASLLPNVVIHFSQSYYSNKLCVLI